MYTRYFVEAKPGSRPVNLTDEQKIIIQTAVDEMHDRLRRTRADIVKHEPWKLDQDLDKYIDVVGSLLALDWGPS